MATTLAYRAYAKINLYLDVVNKRRDGYHNIETIFQSVGLADELSFTEERSQISLTCSMPELATSDQNLVMRAANLLRERTGCATGIHIDLTKNIPIAAGLAGGSTDAAATLIALNRLWELDLDPPQLHQVAAELGSDVPYCMVGGTMAATRRGEALQTLTPLPMTWFVLVHPDVTVSTARIYASPRLSFTDEKPFAGKTPAFRRAIRHLADGEVAGVLFNRMEEAVFADRPRLAKLKARLLEAGCANAAMSGSGATVFGVCASQRQARQVAEAFTDYRTAIVSSVPASVEQV